MSRYDRCRDWCNIQEDELLSRIQKKAALQQVAISHAIDIEAIEALPGKKRPKRGGQ